MITNIRTFVFLILAAAGWSPVPGQTNLGFESGLAGWAKIGKKGNISIDHHNAFEGRSCVRIGPGHAGLEQRMRTLPLAIVQYSFHIKSNRPSVSGYSFIRFFDSAGNLLLEFKSDPVSSTDYKETGNYSESPPGTRYSTIGLYNDSRENGYIYADGFIVNLHVGEPVKRHLPLCNLDQYLQPFWNSDIIYNETVLMYAENGKPASGRLLDTATLILSVKSFGLDTSYLPGRDYAVKDNTITMTPGSRMPFRVDSSFDRKTDLAWFNLQSQWVAVTYMHKSGWDGPVPTYKGDMMPNTMARLGSRSPLRIVAFGMSITRGMDVSGFDEVPPFMPTYCDLFVYELRKKFQYSDITLLNAGLPGAVVDWGAKYADKYVNPLKPDLVILDFGMNDFWRLTPVQFIGYIQSIMNTVKAGNPEVEFLLLSNMVFDPNYILDSDKNKDWYLSNINGYNSRLQQLEKTGVIDLDMTTLSDRIYHHKKPKDCIANPLHPNDYLARWYAQGMAALFDEKK